MKFRDKLSACLLAFITMLIVSLPMSAGAASYENKGLGPNSADPMTGVTVTSDASVNGGVPTVDVPNVQIEQAKTFVERKGFDVVELLQVFAQPFAIILFIFGAFVALMGAFGKSSSMMKGVLVMAIAVVIYAVTLSAPELIDFGNAWLKS